MVIETDVLKLTLSTEGGSVVRSEFLKHQDMADKAHLFVLFDNSKERVYMAQSGLIAGAGGAGLPTHKSIMTLAPGERRLKDGSQSLELRFESPEVGGIKLVKTYTLTRGSYAVAVRHEVFNLGATAVAAQLYLQLVRDGNKPPGESSFYSTFTGPAVYTEAKKYQKVEFADIEKGNVDIEKVAENGYVAMVQHYFASAWLLPDGVKRELFMRKVDNNFYSVGMIAPLDLIAAGASKAIEARFFAGPQEETVLEGLAPGLELVKDYGWLTMLAKPLYWLLVKLHGLISQLGLGDCGAGAAAQGGVLLAQRQGLRQHGQDEGGQPEDHRDARAPERQPAADAAGDDAYLPRGEGQPDGWVLSDHDPDSGVYCAVLGAAVECGDAQYALAGLDP